MTEAEATTAKRPVRVFLVDDHGLFRAGVRAELDSITDEIEVVGEAGTVEDTFAVKIDQVVVGDVELDEPLGALVQAAREAMVNAAKHANVP
ncbi:MAG TPA: histidine kinase, partial [Actinophytocola sp.]|nr:histidine kinase [Actinophytocola sp.]